MCTCVCWAEGKPGKLGHVPLTPHHVLLRLSPDHQIIGVTEGCELTAGQERPAWGMSSQLSQLLADRGTNHAQERPRMVSLLGFFCLQEMGNTVIWEACNILLKIPTHG